jgi:Ca-activated chloride channel family protein
MLAIPPIGGQAAAAPMMVQAMTGHHMLTESVSPRRLFSRRQGASTSGPRDMQTGTSPVPASGAPASSHGAGAMASGVPAPASGAPPSPHGVPAMDSGVPAMDSGVPVMASGVPVMDSGLPAAGGAPAAVRAHAAQEVRRLREAASRTGPERRDILLDLATRLVALVRELTAHGVSDPVATPVAELTDAIQRDLAGSAGQPAAARLDELWERAIHVLENLAGPDGPAGRAAPRWRTAFWKR